MPKQEKYKPTANPEYAAGMVELRRSNASGTHDERPNRERSRSDAKRAAIKRDTE